MTKRLKTFVSEYALRCGAKKAFFTGPINYSIASVYQNYLEKTNTSDKYSFSKLTDDAILEIVNSFSFAQMESEQQAHLQKKIYQALSFLNKKSPTARVLIKQIKQNIEIEIFKKTEIKNPRVTGYTIFGTTKISLNENTLNLSTKEFAMLLVHELGHVSESQQFQPLDTFKEGYYESNGMPLRVATKADNHNPEVEYGINRLVEAEKKGQYYQIYLETLSLFEKIKLLRREDRLLFNALFKKHKESEQIIQINESSKIDDERRAIRYWAKSLLRRKKEAEPKNLTKEELKDWRTVEQGKYVIAQTIKDLLNGEECNQSDIRKSCFGILASVWATIKNPQALSLMALMNEFGLRTSSTNNDWLMYYNQQAFDYLKFSQSYDDEKSYNMYIAIAQAFSEKYNGNITAQEIINSQSMDLRHKKILETYIEIMDQSQNVKRQLENATFIFSNHINLDSSQNNVVTLVNLYEKAKTYENMPIEEAVKKAIRETFEQANINANARDVDGYSFLDSTEDPKFLVELVSKGGDVFHHGPTGESAISRIERKIVINSEFQCDLERELGVQGKEKIIDKLVALSIAYQTKESRHQKQSPQNLVIRKTKEME